MALNLKKHEAAILDAWTKVTEGDDSYDWALFGYEGKSFILKVEAIGSGGIDAIAEEFNDGKVQYGFVKLIDPNQNLSKLLLINFQGEAVLDLVHKGSCANHIREITKLLKNHLTITVTTNDDLDEEVILKKLSNMTSNYNFENRTVPNDEKFVIGTNYSKVVPTKEIDSKRRDEFWKKEEEIEKSRVATEVEAKRLANMKIEEERLKREQQEHQKREQLNKEVVGTKKTISAVKEEIKAISPNKNAEKIEPPAKPRAEELRMERRKEAQELIGNKVNAAKLMFQQQAQSAAKVTVSTPHGPPAKPIRKTINKIEQEQPVAAPPPQEEPEVIKAPSPPPPPVAVEEQISHHDDEQFSTIKRSPRTPTSSDNQQVFIISDNGNEVEINYNAAEQIADKIQEKQQEEQKEEEVKITQAEEQTENVVVATEVTHQTPDFASATAGCCGDEEADQQLLKAVALYDYQAADETEISFDPGDLITHIDCIDQGWWQGYTVRFGTYGLFPANYVQVIDDSQMTE